MLADVFKDVFPELHAQGEQVAKVIEGEEKTFLNTLENGLNRFATLDIKNNIISGQDAFELYDTYGFPIDLTRLLASEQGYDIDEKGFSKALQEQKDRSRADAKKAVGDWNTLRSGEEVAFVGYDTLEVSDAQILKYRTVKQKKKEQYQVVLNKTPFYAESGGQRGDVGLLTVGEEKISVIDTQKENDLIIHIVKKFPGDLDAPVHAKVHPEKRRATSNNHSAVHLMHAAMHNILGEHALQKGQDVDPSRLRFDFSHFQKVEPEELQRIEDLVNEKIRANIPLQEDRAIPIEEAKEAGALMLFGEKYGDLVRMITFDPDYSRELCGGTHAQSTGEIGLFKILSESGVAAGIRRIEAVTASEAQKYVVNELKTLDEIRDLFKNPKNIVKSVSDLQEENKQLRKEVEQLLAAQANALKGDLKAKAEKVGNANFLSARLPLGDSAAIKNLAYQLEKELAPAVIVFGAEVNSKPQLMVVISKQLTESSDLHAGNMIRELAKEIKGGGGGQPFFATAGGKDVDGLDAALAKAKGMVE
jgi:alanyl-tRNA synthetase